MTVLQINHFLAVGYQFIFLFSFPVTELWIGLDYKDEQKTTSETIWIDFFRYRETKNNLVRVGFSYKNFYTYHFYKSFHLLEKKHNFIVL